MPRVTFNRKSSSDIYLPDREPITIEPGTHEVSQEDFDVLQGHEGLVRAWRDEGVVVLDDTVTLPPRPKEPPKSASLDDEAFDPPKPEPEDLDEEEEDEEEEDEEEEDEASLPSWSKSSKLGELQEAAAARGLDIAHLTRAELLDELEAFDLDACDLVDDPDDGSDA